MHIDHFTEIILLTYFDICHVVAKNLYLNCATIVNNFLSYHFFQLRATNLS